MKGRALRFLRGHNLRGRTGEANPNWKGGRHLSTHGYVRLANGTGAKVYEHTVIAERALGRKLRETEVVHHVDGDKTNNAPSNLLICTRIYHIALHARLEKSAAWPQFLPNPRNKHG